VREEQKLRKRRITWRVEKKGRRRSSGKFAERSRGTTGISGSNRIQKGGKKESCGGGGGWGGEGGGGGGGGGWVGGVWVGERGSRGGWVGGGESWGVGGVLLGQGTGSERGRLGGGLGSSRPRTGKFIVSVPSLGDMMERSYGSRVGATVWGPMDRP